LYLLLNPLTTLLHPVAINTVQLNDDWSPITDLDLLIGLAGPLSDFFVFDPSITTWTDLTNSSLQFAPTARYMHGFTSSDGRLYVHGGYSDSGSFVVVFPNFPPCQPSFHAFTA
jgi:hypothetical protein